MMPAKPPTTLRAMLGTYRLASCRLPKWVEVDTAVVRVEFDSVGWDDVATVTLADRAVVRVAVDSRSRSPVRVTARRPRKGER